MHKINSLRFGNRMDRAYVIAYATALITTLVIIRADPGAFERFLGPVDVISAFLITAILGQICLSYLVRTHDLRISAKLHVRTLLPVLLGTMGFGALVILIDRSIPLPADINIAFPVSLLFYPVIGLLAEIVFHAIPMTLISGTLSMLRTGLSGGKILGISMLLTALAEPAYQVYFMQASGDNPVSLITLIGIHVFFFSLFQLYLFKRYAFFHMYLFRLSYYLIWHVLWGSLRLQWV